MHLESRGLVANTINQQLAAVRRLAHEAADSGLLSPELAAGISRVKGVKQLGFRSGNWLSTDQSSEVLKRAVGHSMRAKRDYAMLAMLFGCGFRRSELVGLDLDEVQMRQGHWAVVDLIGKGGHIRTVPIPEWVKAALDQLSPELAAGISRVKGVKQLGFRSGNWLSTDQSSEVLKRAVGHSMRAKRDYAMLAMLFGCGFRRSELVGLDLDEVQMRQGHWAVVDLIGKGGHIRTVPIPEWVKAALDQWTAAAKVTEGRIFRAVARAGKVWGKGISQNVVWYVVKTCCERAGLEHIAPHDLRRTCAKLCHSSGGELEQIQFLLGHASVQTTERYLGCKQNLGHPVNDLFRLGNTDIATYVVLAGTAALTVRAEDAPPDRMSVDESSGDQEGSNERASTRFQGDGYSAV